MLDIALPYCTAVKSGDRNKIVKSLVAASKAGAANANFAQDGFGQSDEDSPLFQALQILQSQPSPGLDTLSEEELDRFLAGLEAPKPTTMLTVPVGMPTKRSTIQATHHDPDVSEEESCDADKERKTILDELGLEPCPCRHPSRISIKLCPSSLYQKQRIPVDRVQESQTCYYNKSYQRLFHYPQKQGFVHSITMRTLKTHTYLRTTQNQPTKQITTIHSNTRTVTMSGNRSYSNPRWESQSTFRNIVSSEEQKRARKYGREVPFLEGKLEMLNRHLLDTNHQLRAKLDELAALQHRRVARKNGELVQENDMLRALHRGGRR
ncbi:hypothetical protein KCU91_g4935, partial [Aureobasidium melanogenum]